MPVRTRKRLYGPRLPEEYNWTSITKPHNGDVYENTLTGDLYTCIIADEPNDAASWYIMPLPGSIPTVDGVVVSGIGAGDYRYSGQDENGYPYYNLTDAPDSTTAFALSEVDAGNGVYDIYDGEGIINTSTNPASYPFQATWVGSTVTAEYLTLTGLPFGYEIKGPGGFIYQFIGAAGTESDAGSWVAAPKVLKVRLVQDFSNLAPVMAVFTNTLGGTGSTTCTRTGDSSYRINKTGAFSTDPARVFMPVQQVNFYTLIDGSNKGVSVPFDVNGSVDYVGFYIGDEDGLPLEGTGYFDFFVTIEVYPG